MRGITRGVTIAIVLVVLGCTSDDTDSTSSAADCASQVRLDGVVYTSHGYAERIATRHSAADAAECHDVGKDAAGSVFPARPRQVTTWTFGGYPPEKVLGVRFDQDSFEVFVADSVPRAKRERIFRELQKPRPDVKSHPSSA